MAVDSPMKMLAEQINELLAKRRVRFPGGGGAQITGHEVARMLERVPGGGLLAPDGGLEPDRAARYRREARQEYHDEGTLEIDDGQSSRRPMAAPTCRRGSGSAMKMSPPLKSRARPSALAPVLLSPTMDRGRITQEST